MKYLYNLNKAGWADNYLMGLVNQVVFSDDHTDDHTDDDADDDDHQVAQANDYSLSREVTNHLFQGKYILKVDKNKKKGFKHFKLSEPGKDYGLDLASLNIQRGREFGTPSYNRYC